MPICGVAGEMATFVMLAAGVYVTSKYGSWVFSLESNRSDPACGSLIPWQTSRSLSKGYSP
jgi:hypothetical protein